MAKSGSKVLTAVIAFLLGFLFAILVEVGAVFGVYYFVTTADLDTIFDRFGIQNRDGDDYIYINTDSSTGGAKNLAELLEILNGYLYSDGSSMDFPVLGKSLDEISNLLPFVKKTLAEKLYPVVDEYLDIDWDEFESVPLTDLAQFLSDSVMNLRPAKLLEKMGMEGLVGGDANPLVRALLAGAEFDYAYTASGLKFPVYYDTYVYVGGDVDDYFRVESVDNTNAYPFGLSRDFLYDSDTFNDDGEREYRLYFIPCSLNGSVLSDARLYDGDEYIYEEGTTFLAVKYDVNADVFELDLSNIAHIEYPDYYGRSNVDRTGNFYYTNEGKELQIYPVTIGSFSDPDEVFKPLYCTRITELMDGDIISALFGAHTVGELIDGRLNLDSFVNNLELAKVIEIDPEESLMAYLGYGLSNVKASGQPGIYTGYVDVDGVSTECFIESVLEGEPVKRAIKRVYYLTEDGKQVEVKGKRVNDVADIATKMEITALLNVKADDAILAYLGYGVSGVYAEAGEGYTHVGKYETEIDGATVEVDAFIDTDEDGLVTEVWYYTAEGSKVYVKGTSIDNISDRISSVTDKLALPNVLKIKADEAITLFVGYGVYDVFAQDGKDYTHVGKLEVKQGGETVEVNVFIDSDEDGYVTKVWYYSSEGKKITVSGTAIDEVSEVISSVTKKLTLPNFLKIKADESITLYVGYGVYSVHEEVGEGYKYVGKYDIEQDGETSAVDVFIDTDEEGYVTKVWYYSSEEEKINISGTAIEDVSETISSVTDKLTLPNFLKIKATESITVYVGYGVSGVTEAVAEDGSYTHKGNYKLSDTQTVECFIATDSDEIITSVWYYDENDKKVVVDGTTVSALSGRINGISNDLTLGDVMTIDDNSSAVLKALASSKISDMGDAVENLKISDVLNADDIQKSAILRQLANKSINELSGAIDAISIQSIYAKEIYDIKLAEGETDSDIQPKLYEGGYNSKLLYFTEKDGVFTYVNSDGGNDNKIGYLTATQFEELREQGVELYTYGEAKGMWRLILMITEYDEDPEGIQHEKVYTLNNFNNMIQSCTQNINNATLKDLRDAGIIKMTDDELGKRLVINGDYENAVKLGELTLAGLIEFIIGFAQ